MMSEIFHKQMGPNEIKLNFKINYIEILYEMYVNIGMFPFYVVDIL